MEVGGKMPAYCPGDELSLCKLSRVSSLHQAVSKWFEKGTAIASVPMTGHSNQ